MDEFASWYLLWYFEQKGGPGSGNYGHKGRPGIRGGSMPGGFSLSGGWAPPAPLEGQPDLAGESTDSLYRTLTAFKRDIKETTSPTVRRGYQGSIEGIQQELTYRGKLKAAIQSFQQGRGRTDPATAKRVDGAIIKLQDMLDKREGTERIKIPTSSGEKPTVYEIVNQGVTGRYHMGQSHGTLGAAAGAMMRGKDGKYYGFRKRSVFEITPDEQNLRGEVPRYKMAYRSKSLSASQAWAAGFAPIIKGGPGSGNWGHAGRRGIAVQQDSRNKFDPHAPERGRLCSKLLGINRKDKKP